MNINRVKEPSTALGLGFLTAGLDQLFAVPAGTAEAVVDVVAPAVFNPTPAGIVMALAGLAAMFLKDTGAEK